MLDEILVLFGQPPGSLVYHFIILFAVEAALAISFGQWLRDRRSATARLTLATLVIGLARLAMLIAALVAWQGLMPRNVLLPPIERAVDTITVIGLAWLFATMKKADLLEPDIIPDAAGAAAVSMSVAGFVGSYYYWFTTVGTGQLFNGQILDFAWAGAQVLLAVGGLVLIITQIRYIYDPFLKGLMLIVLGGAAALHLIQPVPGDVAVAVRIGQLIAMPVLAAMAYRHVVEQLLRWDDFEPEPRRWQQETTISTPLPPVPATPPDSPTLTPADIEAAMQETMRAPEPEANIKMSSLSGSQLQLLEVVEAVGALLTTIEEHEIVRQAPRAVATALRADIALLAVVDEDRQEAGIVGGYDNIAQTWLPQTVLDLADNPSIVNALGRIRQTRLTPKRNLRELREMYERIGIFHEGPTYLQPIVKNEDRLGLLIVGSPYSERLFSTEERNLLDRLSPLVGDALLNAERFQDAREEVDLITSSEGARLASLADDLTTTSAQLNAANQQIEEMKAYIREMHRKMQGELSVQESAQAQLNDLIEELERLRPKAQEASALREQYQALRQQHTELSSRVEEMRQAAAEADQLQRDNAQLRDQAKQRGFELARLEQERDRLKEDAEKVSHLQQEIGALNERYTTLKQQYDDLRGGNGLPGPGWQDPGAAALQQENVRLQQQLERLRAERSTLTAAAPPDVQLLERQLQEIRTASQTEIASLRTRLAQASISQQEVIMLQEQLAMKTREAVDLKTRLTEAQAAAETLRRQLTEGTSVELTAFEQQAEEIARLQEELSEAQAAMEATGVHEQVSELDREAISQLEAQLEERNILIDMLEGQLEEKSKVMAEIRGYVDDADILLERLENNLRTRTEEISRLEASLQQAREHARQRTEELASGQADVKAAYEAEIAALEAEVTAKDARLASVDAELDQARQALEQMEQQLAATNRTIDQAITDAQQADSRSEVIASLAQEMRTPMSSIVGYTELVLGESVGILGSGQRKFLQRVRSNTERLEALINDLINITAIDTRRMRLSPQKVDVLYTVEEAITRVSGQFREKGITLRMALLEQNPPLTADRDAVLDVFGHLLSNAALASPVGGEVQLAIDVREGELETASGTQLADCLYIAVEDSGEGIAQEDMKRVFARKYRADNPLIEGLGDTGVSLSLAKALVEAQDGKIWIESERGVGTVFHVLIPFEALSEA